jgi:hypothetical protein
MLVERLVHLAEPRASADGGRAHDDGLRPNVEPTAAHDLGLPSAG